MTSEIAPGVGAAKRQESAVPAPREHVQLGDIPPAVNTRLFSAWLDSERRTPIDKSVTT
jgi:hypothetical protein